MSSNWRRAGVNHVPAYQVAGIPFVTSSLVNEVKPANVGAASEITSIQFPYVTRAVTIKNTGRATLRVGFSERGIFAPAERMTALHGGTEKPLNEGKNYFTIQSTGSANIAPEASLHNVHTFNIRCKEIFFAADAAVAYGSITEDHKTGFSLLAELTIIHAAELPTLTGSSGGVDSFEGIG